MTKTGLNWTRQLERTFIIYHATPKLVVLLIISISISYLCNIIFLFYYRINLDLEKKYCRIVQGLSVYPSRDSSDLMYYVIMSDLTKLNK